MAILCICSINVFAESEEALGLPKDTDDGMFNWVNREERIYSNGSFDFSFYNGLKSDNFYLRSSRTTISTRNSYSGKTYIPYFSLTLLEKPYGNWTFKIVGSRNIDVNRSQSATFTNLHYMDGEYYFRMDTDYSSPLDAPIKGSGDISNFGGRA